MKEITVVGSLNIDIVVRSPRIPEAGETLAGTDFHIIPGGKGANQAVASSRAGVKTRMVGCIGNDSFGQELMQSLENAGVNTSCVVRASDRFTGTATIVVDEYGENRIIVVSGANELVSLEQIDRIWEKIKNSSMIFLQMEIPLETIFHVIERANRQGITVLLNPAPVYPIPENIISLIDTLIANETEATFLSGLKVIDKKTAFQAATKLYKMGAKMVIITLGDQGAVLVDGENFVYQPSFDVQVVDTTAAGDTFVGAFAASFLEGNESAEALRFATAAAAIAVTKLGAQTSMPNRDEILKFLSEIKEKEL